MFIFILNVFKRYGVRNSLLLAPMPTASTAQILGNNESIEPYTSNIYTRRVLSGEFQVVNHHLLKDLTELNLWNEEMKQKLIAHNGSIQVPLDYSIHLKHLLPFAYSIFLRYQVTSRLFTRRSGSYLRRHWSTWLPIVEPTLTRVNLLTFTLLNQIMEN